MEKDFLIGSCCSCQKPLHDPNSSVQYKAHSIHKLELIDGIPTESKDWICSFCFYKRNDLDSIVYYGKQERNSDNELFSDEEDLMSDYSELENDEESNDDQNEQMIDSNQKNEELETSKIFNTIWTSQQKESFFNNLPKHLKSHPNYFTLSKSCQQTIASTYLYHQLLRKAYKKYKSKNKNQEIRIPQAKEIVNDEEILKEILKSDEALKREEEEFLIHDFYQLGHVDVLPAYKHKKRKLGEYVERNGKLLRPKSKETFLQLKDRYKNIDLALQIPKIKDELISDCLNERPFDPDEYENMDLCQKAVQFFHTDILLELCKEGFMKNLESHLTVNSLKKFKSEIEQFLRTLIKEVIQFVKQAKIYNDNEEDELEQNSELEEGSRSSKVKKKLITLRNVLSFINYKRLHSNELFWKRKYATMPSLIELLKTKLEPESQLFALLTEKLQTIETEIAVDVDNKVQNLFYFSSNQQILFLQL